MKFALDFPLDGDRNRHVVFDEPVEVLEASRLCDVPRVLREAEAAALKGRWVVGFVTYESAPAFDGAMRARTAADLPYAWFGLFDPPRDAARPDWIGGSAIGEWATSTPFPEYSENVGKILAAIEAGDVYQVNYTVRLTGAFAGDDTGLFARLRAAQQCSYAAYLSLGRRKILSLSPELFFRRDGHRVTCKPMKGTAGRGLTPGEDDLRARALARCDKNRAENVMVVDLVRNDLARISEPGGVRVEKLFEVERYPTLLQMTSTVSTRVRPATDLADIFGALFPCGSVTGAPKIASMKLISQLEDSPRGIYCGAIGVLKPGGDAVFSVPIRTLVLDTQTHQATLGVGGGIVADSSVDGEYEELLLKSRFVHTRPADFGLLETIRLEGSRCRLRERHLARMARSAGYFGLDFDPVAVERLLDEVAVQHPGGPYRVRLILAGSGEMSAECTLMNPPIEEPARFALAQGPVSRDDVTLYHKTTRRELYEKALAAKPGVFDVLLWNEEGEMTEFTRGNLVVEMDGRRYTPPSAADCSPGPCARICWSAGIWSSASCGARTSIGPPASPSSIRSGARSAVFSPHPHGESPAHDRRGGLPVTARPAA